MFLDLWDPDPSLFHCTDPDLHPDTSIIRSYIKFDFWLKMNSRSYIKVDFWLKMNGRSYIKVDFWLKMNGRPYVRLICGSR